MTDSNGQAPDVDEIELIIKQNGLRVVYHNAGPYAKLWRVFGTLDASGSKLTLIGFDKASTVESWDYYRNMLDDDVSLSNVTIYIKKEW